MAPPFKITSNEIVFKDVYYNGFHSLQQFKIENLTSKVIMVKLDSTLKDQIAFQLENENIKDLDLSTENLATNTAAWTTFTAPQDLSQFNQLFNYVNHTDHLQLQPNQNRIFIIAFLPIILDLSTPANHLIHINGSVFFSCNDYNLDLNFHATVCQSILASDELDTGLMFEDSLVGEVYIKDITIHNQSAIHLYWRLNTFDLIFLKNKPYNNNTTSYSSHLVSNNTMDTWLQFVDPSTFITLNHNQPEPIPPFSHYTFRVIFTPKEVGKFNYDLQIENRNDVQNIIHTKIHATMRSFMHRDTLVVTSGNSLDFGDCISGAWNNQHIILNNISESPIDIQFMAEGAELEFDIIMEKQDDFISTSRRSSNNFSIKPLNNSSKSSIVANGHLSPSSDTRPISPTMSHETFSSVEEYSSTNSNVSTDNIDMLTALNAIYTNNGSSLTSSIKQVEFTTEKCNTKIEDMVLKPGVERIIQVSYRPSLDTSSSIDAGQFIRRQFNIVLQYLPNKSAKPKELKRIQCKARTCTSFVQVTPQVIDFGDTDVGTQKSFPIQIINQSDICAHVELVFESKVLNCTRPELLMQPKSTVELKLDIYPRKVNLLYCRQIKLKNYLNPDNDQIIEVSSTNIDKYRVTFHSLFYRILTPTGANFLDFGPIALNSPAIRTCTLVNIRDASLLLGIATSSQQEIVMYTKKSSAASSTEIELKKQRITPSVTDALLSKNCRTRLTNAQYSSTAYLDLATVPHERFSPSFKHKRNMVRHMTFKSNSLRKNSSETCNLKNKNNSRLKGVVVADDSFIKEKLLFSNHKSLTFIAQHKRYKKKKQQPCVGITGTATHLKKVREKTIDWPDIVGKPRVPLDDLISILEHGSLSRTPLFARHSLEEQFVRYQLAWRTELARLIKKGELIPTTLLQLNPYEEKDIIIVYTPTITNHSLTSKNTASISFRLIDFDQSVIQTSSSEDEDENTPRSDYKPPYYKDFIPVLRKLIVRAQVCKSCMELGQRNINFGIVDRGDQHHKTIVLHNTSDTPLLYTIKKSGSIASGDIHLGAGRYGVIRSFGKKEIEFTFIPTLPGSFMEQLEVINIRDNQDTNIISLKAIIRRPESFTMKLSTPELIFNSCLVNNLYKETIILTNTNKQSRMFEIGVEFDHVQPQQPYKVEFFIDHGYQQNEKMFLSKEEEEEIENLEQKLKIAERKNQPEKIKKYLKRLSKLKKQQDLSQLSFKEATEDEKVKQKVTIDEDSTLFHLDSNASKSISVCFKAIVQKTNNEGQILPQTNSFGRILIHEHKNIDTRKIISFSVNPCKYHETCLA